MDAREAAGGAGRTGTGDTLPHIAKEEQTGKEAAMPNRSEKRDAARAAYAEKKSRGGKVNLRELAEELGVGYQTIRNWKGADGRGTGTAPDTKTPPGATKGPRRATGMQRRTERTAPSFLIC